MTIYVPAQRTPVIFICDIFGTRQNTTKNTKKPYINEKKNERNENIKILNEF